MRSLRTVKYRKKYRKLVVLAQILAIWYAVVISTAVLTSDTFAYFSSSSQTNVSIQTGQWWDGSKLEFREDPNTKNIKACASTDITIDVINKGYRMGQETMFEVYYLENGNPKQNGKKVLEGIIEPLAEGESITLKYEALENGTYMFKLFQVPGYENDFEKRNEIWSTKYMVKCLEKEIVEDQDEEMEMEEVEEAESKEEIDDIQKESVKGEEETKQESDRNKEEQKETSKIEKEEVEQKKEESKKGDSPEKEEVTEEIKEEIKSVTAQKNEEVDSSQEGDE